VSSTATAARRRHDPGSGRDRPVAAVPTRRLPIAGARTLGAPSIDTIVELQRTAGNQAVASHVSKLQRVGGWAGADTSHGGWNVTEQAVGNVRRIPIDGLLGGLQSSPGESKSARELTTEGVAGTVKGPARSDAAEQKGRGRAIALVPTSLKAHQPVDVLFHLHGHTEHSGRDFGGWRQTKAGQVRDVERDRIAQQIEAAKSDQIVGLLPQGVGASQFGSIDPNAYTRDAFDRLTELGAWTAAPPSYKIVLSTHSGSGFTVGSMLNAGTTFKPPANLKTLVLFEALHKTKKGFNQATQFGQWLEAMLDGHLKYLGDPAVSAKDKQARLDDALQVRLYWDPLDTSYNTRYVEVEQRIDGWFKRNAAATGAFTAALRNLVVFVRKTKQDLGRSVRHEGIVREGITESLDRSAPAAVTPPAPLPVPAPALLKTGATSTLTFDQRVAAITSAMVHARAGASLPGAGLFFATLVAFGTGELSAAAEVLAASGQRNEVDLTDALFALMYPELGGDRIPAGNDDMVASWKRIRREFAKPVLTEPPADDAVVEKDAQAPAPTVPATTDGTTTLDPKKVKAAKAATGVKAMTDEEEQAALDAAIEQATKTGGKQADRDAVENTLLYNGTDNATWWAGMVFDASFLDVPIRASGGTVGGVHKELYARLQIAERRLQERFPGLNKAQIAGQMGIYDIAGLRPPKKATGGTLPSFHCFGLAVDINHDTNPFVGNQKPTLKKDKKGDVTPEDQAKYDEYVQNRSPRVIERAMFLLHGEQFDVEAKIQVPKAQAGSAVSKAGYEWDVHHRASEALAEYLRLADDLDGAKLKGLVNARRATGDARDLAAWKLRIAEDRRVLPGWDFMHHKNPEQKGYMDLGKELVEALAGDARLLWGGAYKDDKDIMHFDWREGTIAGRPPKGWKSGDKTYAEVLAEKREQAAKKAAEKAEKAKQKAAERAAKKKR
jgi:hypothetical protein